MMSCSATIWLFQRQLFLLDVLGAPHLASTVQSASCFKPSTSSPTFRTAQRSVCDSQATSTFQLLLSIFHPPWVLQLARAFLRLLAVELDLAAYFCDLAVRHLKTQLGRLHCDYTLSSSGVMATTRWNLSKLQSHCLTADDCTTVDVNSLTGDEASIRRGQEDVGRAQFRGHADSTDGSGALVPLLQGVVVHGGFLERGPRIATSC